jgi:hypothetical protein
MSNDLDAFITALNTIGSSGADELGGMMIEDAAMIWVDVAQEHAPRDTGQLIARTAIATISDTAATIVVDVPYASEQEYGTRTGVPAVGYFRAGEVAAQQAIIGAGFAYQTAVEEMLESGGHPRPRTLLNR